MKFLKTLFNILGYIKKLDGIRYIILHLFYETRCMCGVHTHIKHSDNVYSGCVCPLYKIFVSQKNTPEQFV